MSVFRPLAESDIFVASPLSLALMLEKTEHHVTDLLSSIEILIVERAEVLLMQNWQHVVTVVQHINQMPKEVPSDVSVMHVRPYFLHNQGKHFRQTLIFSAFPSAEMHALFNGPLCCNHAGRVRFRQIYDGVLKQLPQKCVHRFERHLCSTVSQSADARFEYFKSVSLPKLRLSDAGVLLFVAHYFDFLRICDLLTLESIHYGAISEYTSQSKSKKLRRQFQDAQIHVLITTERAHFYNRPRFKNIQHILFYSLPEHPHFYPELIQSASQISILYSRFSTLQLERIVGTEAARNLIAGPADLVTQI